MVRFYKYLFSDCVLNHVEFNYRIVYENVRYNNKLRLPLTLLVS